jgi:hypothetical protein
MNAISAQHVQQKIYAAFAGDRLLRTGPLSEVLAAVKLSAPREAEGVLFFELDTGTQTDFDLRGSLDDVLDRVKALRTPIRSGPGRPKLGVESREVGLLPKHWEWLQKQPSGASATLRKLVEHEMRREQPEQNARQKRDAVYKMMSALAGNKPNFEEATRALYAGDTEKYKALIAEWPADLRRFFSEQLH